MQADELTREQVADTGGRAEVLRRRALVVLAGLRARLGWLAVPVGIG